MQQHRTQQGFRVRRPRTHATLREAWTVWLASAKAGTIRTRSGDCYKASALRSYEAGMEARVLPVFEREELSVLELRDFQDLADQLLADGHDPSTIRNTFMGLRALYRRAVIRGDVALNPTAGLQLPAVRGRRDRIASVSEADKLLAALPDGDRAVWSTAFFAGLRRGELMALDVMHVFDDNEVASLIAVERSYDPVAGEFITPKSHAGTRRVPVTRELRGHLMAHQLRLGGTTGLLFGRTPTRPFDDRALKLRAEKAWHAAGLTPITLHEARHTYASLLIAAGVNSKAVSTYMGHASITITLDRYGHLMPGNEAEAANLLDAYLARERDASGASVAARMPHSRNGVRLRKRPAYPPPDTEGPGVGPVR
ncbi:MAG: site-specific integrase [Actinobacteria bacterium]|nr:site-specific integrase [Actinomycetota bacterium]